MATQNQKRFTKVGVLCMPILAMACGLSGPFEKHGGPDFFPWHPRPEEKAGSGL